MHIVGLDHVQLAAPPGCQPEARAFFGELLGLEELEKPEALRGRGGCWFALPGGLQLHIGIQEPFVPATKAHPAFLVTAYDALREQFGAPEEKTIAGVRRFFTNDPWGNRLEFTEAVAAREV
jgi:catechol 2,3-dioxygenase-like lactoylglutathione lyase family enzyme